MNIYGYKFNSNRLLTLKELTIECSIEELDNVINFLNVVKLEHESVRGQTELCHSHYRDWTNGWKAGETDIIVVTRFKK